MTIRSIRFATLLLCALSLLLAACGGDDAPDDTPQAEPPPKAEPAAPTAGNTPATPKAPARLADVEWKLVALEPSSGDALTPGAEAVPTLLFNSKPGPDGVLRLIGFGGCNRFFGEYAGDDAGSLSVPSPLGSTRMACPEPIMGLETALMKALASVSGYTVSGGELTIPYADGRLRFGGG